MTQGYLPELDDVMRLALEGEDEEPEVTASEVEANERGITLDALKAEKGIVPKPPWVMGAYERRLAQFVNLRVEEAQFADAWHMLPDDLPINRQPWWKTPIWRMYLAGCESGRKSADR